MLLFCALFEHEKYVIKHCMGIQYLFCGSFKKISNALISLNLKNKYVNSKMVGCVKFSENSKYFVCLLSVLCLEDIFIFTEVSIDWFVALWSIYAH